MMHLQTLLTCDTCGAGVAWAAPVRLIHGPALITELDLSYAALPDGWIWVGLKPAPAEFYCHQACYDEKYRR
jgi:hypothetical protein